MAMSKRTATALEGSIKKWETIVATIAKGDYAEENGMDDCPLCQLYHPENSERERDGCSPTCPIKTKTKRDYCMGSPYANWGKGYQDLDTAQTMLDFLIELRPAS